MNIISSVQNVLDILINLLIALIRSNYKDRTIFSGCELPDKNIVIAMNGPTLSTDIARLLSKKGTKYSYLGANHLADIELFVQLKPSIYVLSDPYFWQDNVSKDLKDKRIATFKNIKEKTDWPLTIFVPSPKAKYFIKNAIVGNVDIIVESFNGAGYPVSYNTIIRYLWSSGFVAPFAQNVLIHAIYISIMLNANSISIVGANFSFHESIYIDQKNNDFYKIRKHVYGINKEMAFKDYTKIEKARLVDEYQALFRTYKILEGISKFANDKGIKVTNYTENSFLDMFKRI